MGVEDEAASYLASRILSLGSSPRYGDAASRRRFFKKKSAVNGRQSTGENEEAAFS